MVASDVHVLKSQSLMAAQVISHLGCQLTCNTDGDQSQVVRHLQQRLGVLLVLDNVAILGAPAPSFDPWEGDSVADLG